ncbi:MAG: ABC transporter ATP-binding protein [Acidobacteriota bacterium]|nr:ABC transporter ATP-binding protein [Acidobacteriota bacterium]
MAVEDPVLAVEDLSVCFDAGRQLKALSQVSVTVGRAEIVGVVGESGCGKSLTALSVMGLLPRNATVTGGRVVLEGVDLGSLSERQRRDLRGRRMSMVFQEPMVALNPLMRAGRQVTEVLSVHSLLSRPARKERTLALFREVGLADPEARYRQYPHQLSGGMRQRVMIAMALAAEPSLLIADEPTTALDPTVQSQILQIFLDIRERLGTSVLLVTHDMGVIAEVADRVTVMYAGRVVESAPVSELFHRPAHPYTAGLLASIPARNADRGPAEDLPTIPGRVPALGEITAGCPFAPRCERAQPRCRQEEPGLLDAGPAHLAACWFPLEQDGLPAPAGSET